jgi:hypothetical protein
MLYMSKPTDRKNDRHKTKAFGIRLHPLIRQQLEALVESKQGITKLSDEIREALIAHLKANGFWPPPAAAKPKAPK